MSKRLTDTDIWEQDWYVDLPNKYKLFWNYIKDKCDNVGIWRPNKTNIQNAVGEPLKFEEFLNFINIGKERIRVLPTGRWWIKDFFVFQYGDKFSPTSQVHKGALKALVQNGIHINEIFNEGIGNLQGLDFQQLKEIAYSKDINNLNVAFGNPSKRVIDKDIVIDNNNVLKVKQENNKDEEVFKPSGNYRSQGEELYAFKVAQGRRKLLQIQNGGKTDL